MVDTTELQGDCTVAHPILPSVTCQIREHPHKIGHFAEGRTEDGVFWNTVWWDRSAVLGDPEGSANHPTG